MDDTPDTYTSDESAEYIGPTTTEFRAGSRAEKVMLRTNAATFNLLTTSLPSYNHRVIQ
jgi:hypothetical protein